MTVSDLVGVGPSGHQPMPPMVVPGHTRRRESAISIPDEVFQRAEREAAQLGITRSEFFSRAAQRYSAELDAEPVTERINAALAAAIADDSNNVAALHGRQTLQDTDDDW